MPPLHTASLLGLEMLVERILRKGADVNFRDGIDNTALHWAASENHAEIAAMLIEVGGPINFFVQELVIGI